MQECSRSAAGVHNLVALLQECRSAAGVHNLDVLFARANYGRGGAAHSLNMTNLHTRAPLPARTTGTPHDDKCLPAETSLPDSECSEYMPTMGGIAFFIVPTMLEVVAPCTFSDQPTCAICTVVHVWEAKNENKKKKKKKPANAIPQMPRNAPAQRPRHGHAPTCYQVLFPFPAPKGSALLVTPH